MKIPLKEVSDFVIKNDRVYYLLVIVCVGVVLHSLITVWKGRESLLDKFLKHIKLLIKYFYKEVKGDAIQRINMAMGLSILILFMLSVFAQAFCVIYKGDCDRMWLIVSIATILFFIPALHICAKYTMHRNKIG
jgi:hypothetical protein